MRVLRAAIYAGGAWSLALAGCASDLDRDSQSGAGAVTPSVTISAPAAPSSSTTTTTTTTVVSTEQRMSTSVPMSDVVPPQPLGPTTSPAPTSSAPLENVTASTVDPSPTRAFPVQDAGRAGFGTTHHSYPATDIFHPVNCGAILVAPVDGRVLELRREDLWLPETDDPSTRGGQFLSILGDDGVRYYMAHFQLIDPSLSPGSRVEAGQVVGQMGTTGRSGACHLHFALSPPCPNPEWWVRRGVVWPAPYLTRWQQGDTEVSPADEVAAWLAEHPEACSTPPPGTR